MAEKQQQKNSRKIQLDTEIYCQASGASYGGDPKCDHDYPDEPNIDKDEYACWICTKCGLKRCYEVWN